MKDKIITVDLGRMETDYSSPLKSSEGSDSKRKKKKYYPTTYISNVEGLPLLPKEFKALVTFQRRRSDINTDDEGKDTGGAELKLISMEIQSDVAKEGTKSLEDLVNSIVGDEKSSDAKDDSEVEDDED